MLTRVDWLTACLFGCCPLQEARQMQMISDYFQRTIPEVPFSDEDAFLAVLRNAGLTDQT